MGLTVIDAGVLIGFLDAADGHNEASLQAFGDARDRQDRVVIAASAFAEALVAPSRAGADAVADVRGFVDHFPVEVVPLDEEIAVVAAGLRGQHAGKLKLPDALVVATAMHLGADVVVTTDRGWPTRKALGLTAVLIIL